MSCFFSFFFHSGIYQKSIKLVLFQSKSLPVPNQLLPFIKKKAKTYKQNKKPKASRYDIIKCYTHGKCNDY